jgi:phosphatidylinositol kinase/protein kinase (PI-3  family)
METAGQLFSIPTISKQNSTESCKSPEIEHDLKDSILTHRKTFDSSLNALFSNDHEESQITKARAILGETVAGISDEELLVYLTEFQYLLDEWLDFFEQQLFEGKTLQQLEREG